MLECSLARSLALSIHVVSGVVTTTSEGCSTRADLSSSNGSQGPRTPAGHRRSSTFVRPLLRLYLLAHSAWRTHAAPGPSSSPARLVNLPRVSPTRSSTRARLVEQPVSRAPLSKDRPDSRACVRFDRRRDRSRSRYILPPRNPREHRDSRVGFRSWSEKSRTELELCLLLFLSMILLF